MFDNIKKITYKITAHLGRREMKVWHFPEQDCDVVMCHFVREIIYYYKNAVNSPDFKDFPGNFPDFPPKMDTLVAV
jgi:hypothetical protein